MYQFHIVRPFHYISFKITLDMKEKHFRYFRNKMHNIQVIFFNFIFVTVRVLESKVKRVLSYVIWWHSSISESSCLIETKMWQLFKDCNLHEIAETAYV